jgi:hypothetical protein
MEGSSEKAQICRKKVLYYWPCLAKILITLSGIIKTGHRMSGNKPLFINATEADNTIY